MNTITVTAFGQPGSLVRRAQESPGFVVDLYRAAMNAHVALSHICADGEHETIRRPGLPNIRDALRDALQAAGGFSPRPPLLTPSEPVNVSEGVAETTLAVTGAEPPLVITGPGGDFRVEHRGCEGCGDLFSAVANAHGRFCQRCLERRQVERMMGGAT